VDRPYNVLFICSGNSARSILAEAILNREGKGRFRAYSAGCRPRGMVDPHVVAVLAGLGHEVDQFRSKSWDEFAAPGAPEMDFVFTVCDDAAGDVCPVWPGHPATSHWGVPDPVKATGSPAEVQLVYDEAYRMLANRIGVFVNLPIDKLDHAALAHHLAEIGARTVESVTGTAAE
jgi:arsenate reductase